MVEDNDYGLTENGFKKKTYKNILDDLKTKAKDYFGNTLNTSDNSPMGYILRITSWFISSVWEQVENVYYNAYIDTANDTSLDRLTNYLGINRLEPAKSTGEITIEGDANFIVPEGTIFESNTEVQFELLSDLDLESGGINTGDIKSLNAGSNTNVEANSILTVVDNISEITSVYNAEATTGGRDLETDDELRDRYKQSLTISGIATVSSIGGRLLNLDNVVDVNIRENTTMTADGNIPAKSIAPVVYGGTNTEVANTILGAKPAGIQCWGEIDVSVEDNMGYEHTIGITRPTTIPIYIEMTLDVDNTVYNSDSETKIKEDIVNYVGIDESIYGLKLGDDVIYNKIISIIYQTEGINDIISLDIGIDELNLGTTNITIGDLEVAITNTNNITITLQE
jgi:uncharacterized phage protein gp47/JayE